jgi:predicted RNA binding protein YcfA (HicA-like mRNA interferase family)
MPKLYSAKEIIKAMRRAGFEKVSQKGSHIKMRGIWRERLQTVIVPSHKQIAFGTFQSILNQSSMTLEEFKTYLR